MESPLCPPTDAGFRLIETFRWEPGRGILRRERHLARLMHSAALLGITPRGVEDVLEALSGDHSLRVRLTIDRDGCTEMTCLPFQPLPEGAVWRVSIADQRLVSNDPWLRLKTTERQIYDAARAALPEGVDEALFLNERDELCEGTITNLFVGVRDRLLTPPINCGLLPGVLREELLADSDAAESVLTIDVLQAAREIYVGNSLRGLIPAQLI